MLRSWLHAGIAASMGALALIAAPAHALDVPPATDRIVDLANVLRPEEKQQLSQSLALFQQETGPQILVLIIPSLEGESVEGYSIKVTDQWKPGDKKKNNGVLLLMSVGDRKVRIEVGQGLEGDLPDILAGRIISDTMVPYFKAGRYRDGLIAGLQSIATRLGGTLKDVPVVEAQGAGAGQETFGFHYSFLLFLLIFLILPRIFGRRSSGGLVSGMLLGGLLGGGRRGGGGFGGFGGGGGGGFSGGGASGNW